MTDMRASMVLKIAVEGKDQVSGLAAEMEALRKAGGDLGSGNSAARASDWGREKAAVEGVTSSFREYVSALIAAKRSDVGNSAGWAAEKGAVEGVAAAVRDLRGTEAAEGSAIMAGAGRWAAEKAEVEGVTAAVRELEENIRRVASERVSVSAAGGGSGAGRPPGAAGASAGAGEEPGDFDWGGYKVPPHPGGAGGVRASEYFAQQRQALEEVEAQAERTRERLSEINEEMGNIGLAAMAFGQLRQFGQDIRHPIESADDAFADFQERTTSLAIQADKPHAAEALGQNLMNIAQAANVPWQVPLAGEERAASIGGGEILGQIGGIEVGLNKLGVASRAKSEELYGTVAHYMQAGLTAQQAFDALKVNYAQGLGGAFELHDMARFQPTNASLARSIGMTPWQAAVDTGALLQILRENTGTPHEAATQLQYLMRKFSGDPLTLKKAQADLGIDLAAIRQTAMAKGADPLYAMLDAIVAKQEAGDPKVLGDIAREAHLRAAIVAYQQHRDELKKFQYTPEQGQEKIDEGYDVANATIAAQRRRAENAKAKAQIDVGRTQAGTMGTVAAVKAGAYDLGDDVAKRFPVMTGVIGTGTDVGGAALSLVGRAGEAAWGIAGAYKAAQWIGTRFPSVGGAMDGLLKAPYDAATGLSQGIAQGVRQGLAEAAGKAAAVEPASLAGRAAAGGIEAGGALRASGVLGSLVMLAAWASKSDIGVPPDMQARMAEEARREHQAKLAGAMGGGGPSEAPVPNIPVRPSATQAMSQDAAGGTSAIVAAIREGFASRPPDEGTLERARRSAIEYRQDPEAARGRAMMEHLGQAKGSLEAPVTPKIDTSGIEAAMGKVAALKAELAGLSGSVHISVSTEGVAGAAAAAGQAARGITFSAGHGVRKSSAALHDGFETK